MSVDVMMKRALYRSVWFWLGCFVLLFLVWVWADSWTTATRAFSSRLVGEDTGGGGFNASIGLSDGVIVDSGCVMVNWSHVTITGPGREVRPIFKRWLRQPAEFEVGWFPKPWVLREVYGNIPGATVVRYQVEVPMWGIVGLYLMGCGAVVAWRRRRWKRLAQAQAQAQAEIS